MRARSVPTALVLAALALAACGGGDDDGGGGREASLSAEEQAYADAWAATLSDDDDGFNVSDDDAACLGEAIMAELGVAPFEEAGIEPDDIDNDGESDDSPGQLLGDGVVSQGQADAILDDWEACTDLPAAFAESATEDFDLDAEAEKCVADGLREGGLLRSAFSALFTSSSDEPPAEVINGVVALLDRCSSGEGGEGGVLVDSIAESIAADSNLDEADARCLAQDIVDTIGAERLLELGAGGDFENIDAAGQQEIGQAVISAAGACDVPLSELGA